MVETISAVAALDMAVAKKVSQSHRETLRLNYASNMKSLRDTFANWKSRTGKFFDRNTIDSSQIGYYAWRG
jgi:hypothetical protein